MSGARVAAPACWWASVISTWPMQEPQPITSMRVHSPGLATTIERQEERGQHRTDGGRGGLGDERRAVAGELAGDEEIGREAEAGPERQQAGQARVREPRADDHERTCEPGRDRRPADGTHPLAQHQGREGGDRERGHEDGGGGVRERHEAQARDEEQVRGHDQHTAEKLQGGQARCQGVAAMAPEGDRRQEQEVEEEAGPGQLPDREAGDQIFHHRIVGRHDQQLCHEHEQDAGGSTCRQDPAGSWC